MEQCYRVQQHSATAVTDPCVNRICGKDNPESSLPVFPGLHSVPIQQIVQGFPVVVHFVTVMDDVEGGAEQADGEQ